MRNGQNFVNQPINIKLVGGIGNQLFGYFAGSYLAKFHNTNLILDVSDIRSGIGKHDVSIEKFNLPGKFIGMKFRSPLLHRINNKLIRLTSPFRLNSRHYYSPAVGFDENLTSVIPGKKIHGYFQTYKYFAKSEIKIDEKHLLNPSSWFINKLEEISDSNGVALHVRRGDYVDHGNLYGLLSIDYYMEAIQLMESLINFEYIWVFSDDIDQAKELFSGIINKKFIWVDPEESSEATESLILLSKFKGIITANSTFSWWAAAISSPETIVCCPKKWYQGMQDPEFLLPPNWKKVTSHWAN